MSWRRAPEFWRRDGWPARLLAPAGLAYAAAGALRGRLVQTGRAPVPVVCVGNAVAGGAGKTPVAIAVALLLRERLGLDAHLLSRGYGGRLAGPVRVDPRVHDAAAVGDEPLLLARAAPAWVARDRLAGAMAAEAAGAGAIVLDDGLQDQHLAKDVSFLVIDGGYGFGNGRVLPAGPLREPAARALARADAIVVVQPENVPLALPAGMPVFRGRLLPLPEAEALAGRPVLAFAGIGRPEKFFAMLRDLGCRLAGAHAFADHHRYRPDEVMALCEAAARAGAIPVTTEKDHVRLPAEARGMVRAVPVAFVWHDEQRCADWLRARLSRVQPFPWTAGGDSPYL